MSIQFDTICLDVYGTLADTTTRTAEIWQGIMGDFYQADIVSAARKILNEGFFDRLLEGCSHQPFLPINEVYRGCALPVEAVKELGLSASVIGYHIMYQHGFAPLFDEVPQALNTLLSQYRVVLCGDACEMMMKPLVEQLPHQALYLSEQLQCYKGAGNPAFLSEIAALEKTAPKRILYVGDSWADVKGANDCGMVSCWMNRSGQQWTQVEYAPAYQINSLDQLLPLLLSI